MSPAHRPVARTAAAPEGSQELHKTLTELLWAHSLAENRRTSPWEFAVTLAGLLRNQVTETGLRFLVSEGYVSHGIESTAPGASTRQVAPALHLLFGSASCFVLTAAGVTVARGLPRVRVEAVTVRPEGDNVPLRPRWVKSRRALLWEDRVVLQFQRAAGNRESILSAFEAAQWPERLADVLKVFTGRHSPQRLHDAVKNLNRMQPVRLIRFTGDGTGRGVCWELLPENLLRVPQASP